MRAFAHAPTEPRRVLILGGGFGGIYAALELEKVLARHTGLDVTLVTRDNFFLFTPMLHEVAASDLELSTIVNPLRKLLRRVSTFVGDIEAIDLAARRVTVSHGLDGHTHDLSYDHVVLALGSSTNFYGLPGVEECALTIKSLGDAVTLRNVAAAILGRAQKPFRFRTLGQLAAIGRRTGVANVFGIRFSGFVAWWLWRTIYLSKLPRLEKKVRVALDWTLDLCFAKDFACLTDGTS